jgi:hypothetical protein
MNLFAGRVHAWFCEAILMLCVGNQSWHMITHPNFAHDIIFVGQEEQTGLNRFPLAVMVETDT